MVFPTLKQVKFGYVNLNLEAIDYLKHKNESTENNICNNAVSYSTHPAAATEPKKNPLIDPDKCQLMVEATHKKYNLDFSYGGWMEDRSVLWKDSYLEEKQAFIHLGIDLNVPPGTEVAVDFDAVVEKIDSDYPEEGGWGTRVIFKHATEPVYIIYAHLDPELSIKEDDEVHAGQIFAKVGKAPYNGGWFPHLHVQVVEVKYFEELKGRAMENEHAWSELDGYGKANEIEVLARRFFDPMRYVRV